MSEIMPPNEFVMCIRKLMEEEMDAINSYQLKIERCPCELCKKVLTDIMNEEKKHVGELTFVIATLAPEESMLNAEGFEEAVNLAFNEEPENTSLE